MTTQDIKEHLKHLAGMGMFKQHKIENKPEGMTAIIDKTFNGYSVKLKDGDSNNILPFIKSLPNIEDAFDYAMKIINLNSNKG